ncbi:dual specificity protein phosphatase family protein [Chryseobacterium sp. PTM-20240506]|uniref:dual specificity protein phosphatase family protein n=1 Tax=unclassified Chryseobacterium TaxID=2593645 RepID=UPI002359B7CB|nr:MULTISPECIES: dual specificity protein phosphatase family protein [unclassified Chryseobacterium]MDC8104094.1 dual specificity protein phosphatase family protein [Chryseobacterium sp. B21-037]MDQ1803702.1 dual specificity protein phosphatase family protein [Chryseobacterium sp. CKR4-1]
MSLNFKNNTLKKILIPLLIIAFLFLIGALYQKKVRYNLVTISENKVYNSGVIPPDKLPEVLKSHNIKTVIDLRDGLQQTELNPETKKQVNAEENAVDKLSGIHYFNLPTDQIPQDSTVKKFLSIMDNPKNYPVLIHCHHGVGRSRLFSSLYRIEYENFTNEEARANARFLWEFGSNFSKNSDKGTYLLNYKKRTSGKKQDSL